MSLNVVKDIKLLAYKIFHFAQDNGNVKTE